MRHEKLIMQNKIKHLEMLQLIISRLSSNSFLLKGWSVTLVVALFALSSNSTTRIHYFLLAYLPVILFWILDGYYLGQERAFRKLYEKVRTSPEDKVDFSMNTKPLTSDCKEWAKAFFSITLLVFYLALILSILVVLILDMKFGG